jgi:hypothetical protein
MCVVVAAVLVLVLVLVFVLVLVPMLVLGLVLVLAVLVVGSLQGNVHLCMIAGQLKHLCSGGILCVQIDCSV